MKRAIVQDEGPFQFRDENGNVIPSNILFTTYGDVLLEHVIKTITPAQMATLEQNRDASQWIINKRVWMRLIKRDYPRTFHVAHEAGTPTQMKPYYMRFLDNISLKKRQHTYWKRYYEYTTKLLAVGPERNNEAAVQFFYTNNLMRSFQNYPDAQLHGPYRLALELTREWDICAYVVTYTINNISKETFVMLVLHSGLVIDARTRTKLRKPDTIYGNPMPEGFSFIVPGTAWRATVLEGGIRLGAIKIPSRILVSCNICDSTEDLQHCGGCQQVAYCSTKCQQMDWKKHSNECH